MGRVNKKKYTEAVSSEENNTEENNRTQTDTDSISSKKLRIEEDDEESVNANIGKKSAKVAGGNAKTAKKRAMNYEDQEEEGSDTEDQKAGKNSKKSLKTNSKKVKNGKDNIKNTEEKQEKEKVNEFENEEDDDDKEYEVQDIVDSKVEGGKKFYLVRWKGYSADDNTWEPKKSLSCKELIEKFEKKNAESTNGKPKKGEKSPAKPAGKSPGKDRKSSESTPVDPTKEWEVDKIIDYAQDKDGFLYRIRWKGYSAKHDTWEPRENLFCDDLIEKFDKRMKELENVSFKELRQEPKKTKRLVNETSPRTNYHNPIGRSSKRTVSKKRVYYGDSDE